MLLEFEWQAEQLSSSCDVTGINVTFFTLRNEKKRTLFFFVFFKVEFGGKAQSLQCT